MTFNSYHESNQNRLNVPLTYVMRVAVTIAIMTVMTVAMTVVTVAMTVLTDVVMPVTV